MLFWQSNVVPGLPQGYRGSKWRITVTSFCSLPTARRVTAKPTCAWWLCKRGRCANLCVLHCRYREERGCAACLSLARVQVKKVHDRVRLLEGVRGSVQCGVCPQEAVMPSPAGCSAGSPGGYLLQHTQSLASLCALCSALCDRNHTCVYTWTTLSEERASPTNAAVHPLKPLAKSSGCCIPLCFPDPVSLERLLETSPQSWDIPLPTPRHPPPLEAPLQTWPVLSAERATEGKEELVPEPRVCPAESKDRTTESATQEDKFISFSFSQLESKLPRALPKPSPRENQLGWNSAAQTASAGPCPPVHWARRPCWAPPRASCRREEQLRAETGPEFLRGTFCQIRGHIYFFFFLPVKIKFQKAKGNFPPASS